MRHWLFKTEPDTFSIDDLKKAPKKTEMWDGIRNYQARNLLRDEVKKGDEVFIYHSSCKVPAIAGIGKIVKAGYVDPTQFDPEKKYYDPKANPDNPRWYCVDVKYISTFKNPIPLKDLKANPALAGMKLLQKGVRLSILPVSHHEWDTILKAAGVTP